jgi:hypothetical protein
MECNVLTDDALSVMARTQLRLSVVKVLTVSVLPLWNSRVSADSYVAVKVPLVLYQAS